MSLNTAFSKYKDAVDTMLEDVAFNENNSDARVEEKRRNVSIIVYDVLVNDSTIEWCKHREFQQAIEESKKSEDFRPEKASQAFSHIENYILLIILMPWKKEYRKITKYCGFYKNAVESNLLKAEPILKLAGFIEKTQGVLVLTKVHKPEELKYIAFECFVASTALKIEAEAWEKAKLSRHSKFKVMYGDSHIPEAGSGKYTDIKPENVIDGIKTNVAITPGANIDRSSTEHYRTRLKEHLRQAERLAGHDSVNTDFPFVDDDSKQSIDFEEGTLEDHVKASLQVVENNESTPTAIVEPHPRQNISASQEWSFVHEGLKQKFGNQYFEGPRKDILSTEGDNVTKQKPSLRPVKFGGDPWSERIKDARHLPEGQVQNVSIYDSAYQSGLQAQFPPAIQSSVQSDKQYLSRSVSSAAGRKHDTDVLIKKPRGNSEEPLLSRTMPIMRRTSAPVQQEEPITNQFSKMHIYRGNEQGVDTLRNVQNMLPKDANVGTMSVKINPSVASMVSSARSSGLGGSYNSRGFTGKGADGLGPVNTRNEHEGLPGSPNLWPCKNCTYVNDCSSNICKMCSKTRFGQLDTDAPSIGSTSKVCDKCTLENDCSSTQCQACGNALRGSQTVV